jgi:hypothetical protein
MRGARIDHRASAAHPLTEDDLEELRTILLRGLDAADARDRVAVDEVGDVYAANDAVRRAGGSRRG